MSHSAEQPVIVGRFGKAFGVFGWIKVISFTNPLNNILTFAQWLVKKDNVWNQVYLEGSKEHINNLVVKLRGYTTPESVGCLTNSMIGVWRKQLPQLQTDEYYWHDLIGLKVVNCDGVQLGLVQNLLATGVNDVLVVKGTKKYLIPYITNSIKHVDLQSAVITVDWGEDFY